MEHQRPRTPQPKSINVTEHCRKFGIKPAEEKKLLALLGKQASPHELQHNAPPRPPRYR